MRRGEGSRARDPSELRPMKVRISDPALLDDLARFLSDAECVLEPVDADVLDVAIPGPGRPDAAALELDLYLRAWEAVHEPARAERVDVV